LNHSYRSYLNYAHAQDHLSSSMNIECFMGARFMNTLALFELIYTCTMQIFFENNNLPLRFNIALLFAFCSHLTIIANPKVINKL
jgi:hypothetical protein